MNKSRFYGLLAAPLLMLALTAPGHADDAANPTQCKDGTTSAASGRGACSGHGGVLKKATAAGAATAPKTASGTAPAPMAPASSGAAAAAPAATSAMSQSAPAATTGNTDPTGATAKCKDGTFSKSKSHSGACSHHGGVGSWLTAAQ